MALPRALHLLGPAAPAAHPYHSLEDFLIAELFTPGTDAEPGGAAGSPAGGRRIAATVLAADISGVSAQTAGGDPTQTLAEANRCLEWIVCEALAGRPGIVDRYTNELTIVFSPEFGSADPFDDALDAARRLARSDAFPFMSRVGIASGDVVVGYVGTACSYTCSVFGEAVALAARCAGVAPRRDGIRASISFPAPEWGDRRVAGVFPPQREPDRGERPPAWMLLDTTAVGPGDVGTIDVRHLVHLDAAAQPRETARAGPRGRASRVSPGSDASATRSA